MASFIYRLLGIRSDFESIFFKNEYNALAGERRRTILALCSILFFTFLALGYAVGGIGNLQRKMENPFTNWVDVEVRSGMGGEQKLGDIQRRYNDPSVTNTLQLKSMTGWVKFYQNFNGNGYDPLRQKLDTLVYQIGGRTIESTEVLLVKVLEPKNIVWHAPDFDPLQPETFDGCQFIITEAMMRRLGFQDPGAVMNLCLFDSDMQAPMFVQVAAIVKELPNFCNYLCSPKLFNILKAKPDGNKKCQDLVLSNVKGSNIFYLLTDKEGDRIRLDSLANSYFEGKNPSLNVESELVAGGKSWQSCRLAFLPTLAPSLDSVRQFLAFARQSGIAVCESASIDCGANMCSSAAPADYHYLAFNFDRLDRIRAFSQDMVETFDVNVDMGQVEAKENFALVSRLTFAISLILLGFGILSIVLFVNNLLRTHLFEVRSNLGTFQAFGLNNRFLIRIYLKIIFSFLALAVGVALVLAICVDRVEQFVMGEESLFNIFSPWIVASIVGLMCVGLWLSYGTIKRILSGTPGDLIYER